MSRAPWPGRIFFDAGVILYIGPGGGAEFHSHNAVQLVRSVDGMFDITVGQRHEQRSAVLIAANTEHSLDAAGRIIALMLVESHGARGAALQAAAEQAAGGELGDVLARVPFPTKQLRAQDVGEYTDRVLDALGVRSSRVLISAATRRAIAYIERHLEGVPRVGDVGRMLSLSETRVTHLFSKEVGIPFRRFVLWTRIKRAVAAYQTNSDLTAAAIEAGFSDAAHFSRTFRAMFGLPPSLVLAAAVITGSTWAKPP